MLIKGTIGSDCQLRLKSHKPIHIHHKTMRERKDFLKHHMIIEIFIQMVTVFFLNCPYNFLQLVEGYQNNLTLIIKKYNSVHVS